MFVYSRPCGGKHYVSRVTDADLSTLNDYSRRLEDYITVARKYLTDNFHNKITLESIRFVAVGERCICVVRFGDHSEEMVTGSRPYFEVPIKAGEEAIGLVWLEADP